MFATGWGDTDAPGSRRTALHLFAISNSFDSMSAPPSVSVVIPAYNHERFVATAIDSVLGQSFQDFELLVVDDASCDGTWEIVTTVRDPRMRAVRHTSNLGAPASLNEGIAESRGGLVAILNSDDVFHPERLEHLVAAAHETRSDDFFAFTDVDFIDADGASASGSRRAGDYLRLREACGEQEPALWFLAGNPAVSTSNFFFSRSVFDAVGGFSALRYAHDWDWAARASNRCSPAWVHESLLSYRIHESNTLVEGDVWRHIHENSYVQASALLRLRADESTAASPFDATCRALLRNESLHPLSLLCFLVCGLSSAGSDSMRELTRPTDGQWTLRSLAEAAGYPVDLFQSSTRLIEICRTIVEQAAMIDERWNTIEHMGGEIASRDRWIDDLNVRLATAQQTVTERDLQLESMQHDLAEKSDLLAALHASRLVRLAMSGGRMMRRLGIAKMDPRLRED